MTKKTVLITGCSSGIGHALAKELHNTGYKVYATARNIDSLASLSHAGISTLVLDVNNDQQIQEVITQIQQNDGLLNCVINNAGFAAMGPVAELDTEALKRQFATNVFAPMALTRASLPLLLNAAKQGQSAQVVNIGSISGILTTPFSGAYCATKSAIHSLSDALRMELKPFGVDVITVQPGAIQSEFGNNALANLTNVIAPTSLFAPFKSNIKARATASQENPTPAAEFARILVAQLLNQPKAEIKIGNGSKLLPFIKKWLPTRTVDSILMKKFGLTVKR